MTRRLAAIVLLLYFVVVPHTAFAWDLSTASYDSVSFNASAQNTNGARSLAFSADGTKMYIGEENTMDIFQYTLSTAWDISTASYASKSYNASESDCANQSIWGLTFNPSGTRMYIPEPCYMVVLQYDLSVAWDITTASYDTSLDISNEDSASDGPYGAMLNSDGTKFYVTTGGEDRVFQYSLSTPYDVDTASYDSVSFSHSAYSNYYTDMRSNSDGTKFYLLDATNDAVDEFALSTGFDVSTMSYNSETFSVSSQVSQPAGLFFKSDGSKMYVINYSSATVYQYSLDSPAQPVPEFSTWALIIVLTGVGLVLYQQNLLPQFVPDKV